MPIRFRCGKCNQLLGISRRKAGTVVRCPSCATELMVPTAEAASPPRREEQKAGNAAAGLPPFEGSDFAKLFEPTAEPSLPAVPSAAAAARPPAAAVAPPAESKPANEFAFDVEPVNISPASTAERASTSSSTGLLLTPLRATLLAVVVIILLALAFLLGLVVGYFLFHAAPPADAASIAAPPA